MSADRLVQLIGDFSHFKNFQNEIVARDKTSLDITWLKDKSLADLDNLPDPDELALEIVKNLEAGLESFRSIIE